MKIDKIEILVLDLPFKRRFSHALKKRSNTKNVIVKIYSGNFVGIGEAIPREYVTGESVESVLNFLEDYVVQFYEKYLYFLTLHRYFFVFQKIIKKNLHLHQMEL